MKLYQVNIAKKTRQAYLLLAENLEEAIEKVTHPENFSYPHAKMLVLDYIETSNVDEAFPVRIEEDVMSKESKHYHK